MSETARKFIAKMKVRDMRKQIREDFKPEDIDFKADDLANLIVEERLPLDFLYDTIVDWLS